MKLFAHQAEALKQTKKFNRVAYYLDMGLGKTFVGSEKMKELGKHLNILVCQKSLISTWMEHFEKYYSMDFTVIDGTTATKEFIDASIKANVSPVVIIINYDLLFRRSYFLLYEDFTLMLDESSVIQNGKAKRSKFVLKMKAANVILLSGTPSSGKYENLWTQLHLLGWSISEKLYNRQYVNWKKLDGDFPMWVVDKDDPYKNVNRLKSKLREHGAVFMKTEECFQLPEQTFTTIRINTTKEYRRFQKTSVVTVYVEPSKDCGVDPAYYGENIELVGDTVLTKRLYSRQLCGQYNQDKLQAFKDLAESTLDRLIVFYNFDMELELLKRIAADLGRPISQVNGHTKDLTAYETEDNSITLIQYQAGSMGLNLQKANKIVYFTLTDKSELFEQSKKRIHRIGQKNNCFYYMLICRNSVEEAVLQALEERKDFNDELFRRYEDTWTKDCGRVINNKG